MNAVTMRLISPAKPSFYRSVQEPQLHRMPFTHLKDVNTRAWQSKEYTIIIIISSTAPAKRPILYLELIAARETLITTFGSFTILWNRIADFLQFLEDSCWWFQSAVIRNERQRLEITSGFASRRKSEVNRAESLTFDCFPIIRPHKCTKWGAGKKILLLCSTQKWWETNLQSPLLHLRAC